NPIWRASHDTDATASHSDGHLVQPGDEPHTTYPSDNRKHNNNRHHSFPKARHSSSFFTGSHFDEKAAELVGFSSVLGLRGQNAGWGMAVAISFTYGVMLVFEQCQVRVSVLA